MTRLPDTDWTKRADLAALVAALGADNARYVGGAVRDTLLGKAINDIDLATTLVPHSVIDRCKDAGIRTVPTGIDHGTVTAVLPDSPVEITTLRRDISTDGRRATVAFAEEWREDAARRDFTINALYAHPETLEIDDYFGGLADLEDRRVRFIGDARERIREDHLRILRYFRFQARFGDAPEGEAIAACSELAHTLKGLSRERVAMELLGILSLPDPRGSIALMAENGEREQKVFDALVAHEALLGLGGDPVRRLAALLPPIPSIAEAVAARLRLSRAQRGRLSCIAGRRGADAAAPRALAYAEGIECARDRLLIAGGDIEALSNWEVPQLPLKGGEIVARGIDAGPDVARILRAVEARWVAEEFPDAGRVAELLEEALSGHARP